jgi:hypothetical protein
MHYHLVHDSFKNILSIIFYPILLKQEGEFSIKFARDNFYAHGQFHVSQWSQGDRWTCQSEPWPHSPPILFARPESMWFLAIWNVEAEHQGSSVSDGWKIMTAFDKVWDELTLDDLQSVFFNWIGRFEWVNEHGENITQIKIQRLSESLSHGEIEGSRELFHTL